MITADIHDGKFRTVASESSSWHISIRRTLWDEGTDYTVTITDGGIRAEILSPEAMACLSEVLEAFGFCKRTTN